MADITEAEARNIVEFAVITVNEFEKYLSEANQSVEAATELNQNFEVISNKILQAAQQCSDTFANSDGKTHTELELPIHNAVASFRSSLVGVKQQASSLIAPALRVLAQFHGFLETDPATIIQKLSQYYRDTGRRIQSRGVSVASTSAGKVGGTSNTGNGTVYTHTTDEKGDPIDNFWPETVEFRCIADEHSGATEHQERFEIRGEPANPSGLSITGSGNSTTDTAKTPSDSILLNSSFTSYSGSTFTNWVKGGSGTVAADTTTYYRDSTGETTPVAIKFTTTSSSTLTQPFSTRRLQLDPNVPYMWHLAYKASSTATGNLKVTVGDQGVQTAAFNGASDSDWQVFNRVFWFDNVNKESPNFVITVDSLAGSGTPSLHIDDLIVTPMSTFNNLPYCIFGGSNPFLVNDRFTIDVTAGTAGVGLVNEWLWKAYNSYLPCEASPAAYSEGTPSARDWRDPAGYS